MTADSRVTQAITSRYRDAYTVATTVVGFGYTIKGLGILVGGVFALAGLVMSSNGGAGIFPAIAAFAFAIVSGLLIYLCGVFVSAQGQVLRAMLDTAVNTSPFLDDGARASAMSLPLSTAPIMGVPVEYQGGM